MIEIALNQAVIAVVGMVTTGVIGFLAGVLKQHTKREKARIKIEKAMARQMIFELDYQSECHCSKTHYTRQRPLY